MKQMHQKEKTMRMINEEITTNKITSDLLDAVEEIRPVIETGAPRAEADRKLPQEVFDAMYDAGLFGLLAPKAYGGFELPLPEVMRVWEAVAHIDSAAGWNLVMNQGLASFIAWLPDDGAEELMADGPATVAGGFFPPGTAKRAEGGWEVTARVPFASGCHNAKWHWLPALETEDGEPVMDPESGNLSCTGFSFPVKRIILQIPGIPSACAEPDRPISAFPTTLYPTSVQCVWAGCKRLQPASRDRSTECSRYLR
jgi:hypothetical protein